MTELPTFDEVSGADRAAYFHKRGLCRTWFEKGQASAQPVIEAHEAEIENLEGFLALSDDAVRAKTEEIKRKETGARLKVVEYRCDTLLLELKNTVSAAIKMGNRVEALEARANTLAAHADPSIAPDGTSPL